MYSISKGNVKVFHFFLLNPLMLASVHFTDLYYLKLLKTSVYHTDIGAFTINAHFKIPPPL